MVYPIVVSTIAVLVIAIIMIFVVPTFSKMFDTAWRDTSASHVDDYRPE